VNNSGDSTPAKRSIGLFRRNRLKKTDSVAIERGGYAGKEITVERASARENRKKKGGVFPCGCDIAGKEGSKKWRPRKKKSENLASLPESGLSAESDQTREGLRVRRKKKKVKEMSLFAETMHRRRRTEG